MEIKCADNEDLDIAMGSDNTQSGMLLCCITLHHSYSDRHHHSLRYQLTWVINNVPFAISPLPSRMLFGNAAMLNYYLIPQLSAHFNSYVQDLRLYYLPLNRSQSWQSCDWLHSISATICVSYQSVPRLYCDRSRNQGGLLYELLPLHWAHAPNLIARLF